MDLRISAVAVAVLGLMACKTPEAATQPAPAPAEHAATPVDQSAAPTGRPGGTATAARVAVATLEGKSGTHTTGTASFTRSGDQVTIILEVNGLAPGTTHAAHIHDKGDCSAPDASSAGGHWNPAGQPHGQWGHDGHHLGDLGNLTANADGNASLTLTTDKWTLGTGAPNDILGHAIVIHAGVDDFTTQPTGNAGGRVGCGVIKSTQGQ